MRSFLELQAVRDADRRWLLFLERSAASAGKKRLTGREMANGKNATRFLTPTSADPGSSVNEYGGGCYAAGLQKSGLEVYFVQSGEDEKRGLFRFFVSETGKLAASERLLPAGEGGVDFYCADLVFSDALQRLFFVRERRAAGVRGRVYGQELCSWDEKSGLCILARGADFYASPVISPDGHFLAWGQWNFPDMPWEGMRVFLASADHPEDAAEIGAEIAGAKTEPCFVVEDSGATDVAGEERRLVLYVLAEAGSETPHFTPLKYEIRAGKPFYCPGLPPAPWEIGLPHWQFGQKSLLPLSDGRILARFCRYGLPRLGIYDPDAGEGPGKWRELPDIHPAFAPLYLGEKLGGPLFACLQESPFRPASIQAFQLSKASKIIQRHVLEDPREEGEVFGEEFAAPRFLSIPVKTGGRPDGVLGAVYYPPLDQKFERNGLYPLIVKVHGGPTAQISASFDPKIHYWREQGFGLLEVDYRGSTGYGRAFRKRLEGQWGVLDAGDILTATAFALENTPSDPARCFLRGSSAGGLTVLAALRRQAEQEKTGAPRLFQAAACLYGVTDLEALHRASCYFESRYFDSLIGDYGRFPERYRERSPKNWADEISAPVLFLHGDADRVVPFEQAKRMAESMKNGVFHLYPGEGHGFGNPAVVSDALKRERDFYLHVFE